MFASAVLAWAVRALEGLARRSLAGVDVVPGIPCRLAQLLACRRLQTDRNGKEKTETSERDRQLNAQSAAGMRGYTVSVARRTTGSMTTRRTAILCVCSRQRKQKATRGLALAATVSACKLILADHSDARWKHTCPEL